MDVLLVEDSRDDALLLERELRRSGLEVGFGVGPPRVGNTAGQGTSLSSRRDTVKYAGRRPLRLAGAVGLGRHERGRRTHDDVS